MITRSTIISPLMRFTRVRMLAGTGQVLAAEGQKVDALTPVAATTRTGHFIRADLRKVLGTKSLEAIHRTLQRKAGDILTKGDVIAQTKGIVSRIYRAPADCQIISMENGEVLLEVEPARYELLAGYSGVVISTIPNRGIVLECEGSLIQGAWSNGKSGSGMLFAKLPQPDQELTRSNLEVTSRGSIYLAGSCLQMDALQAAMELPVRGLLLSSLSSELMAAAIRAPFPILVLDGFGSIPMNSVAFKLLTTSDQKNISIFSPPGGSFLHEKPEAFIALSATANSIEEAPTLAVGQKVRCNISPYTGKCGTITLIHKDLVELPSNIYASCIDVQLENDQKATIPVANMDILYS